MNNRKFLIGLLSILIPVQAMGMELFTTERLQNDLNDHSRNMPALRAQIRTCRTRKNTESFWTSVGGACCLGLSSFCSSYFWFFKNTNRSQRIGSSIYMAAIAGGIGFFALQAARRLSIYKDFFPGCRELSHLKADLRAQEEHRIQIYTEINRRNHAEVTALRQVRATVQANLATTQTGLERMRQQSQDQANELERVREQCRTAETRNNDSQQILNQIRQTHPELIPVEVCDICLGDVVDRIRLDCGHCKCRGCLRAQFDLRMLEQNTALLRCSAAGCDREFTPADIRSILNNDPAEAQLFNRYLEVAARALIDPANRIYCPTANCASIFEFVGDRQVPRALHCDRCNTDFCANCGTLWGAHTHRDRGDLTCEVAQREARLAREAATPEAVRANEVANEQYIEQNAVACPFCRLRLQRGTGCNHIICGGNAHTGDLYRNIGCHRHFCWLCLTEWDVLRNRCPRGCQLFDGVLRRPATAQEREQQAAQ